MTQQPLTFDPAHADPRSFRAALGRFATGVTVVTCKADTGPLGMTANSFASVSLDPPLVLWSPAKASERHDVFVAAEDFAVHVLAAGQEALCNGFAHDAQAFDNAPWQWSDAEVPIFDTCLSRFECKRVATHDGGDHTIIVARVMKITTREGDPLVFYGGDYGRFQPI